MPKLKDDFAVIADAYFVYPQALPRNSQATGYDETPPLATDNADEPGLDGDCDGDAEAQDSPGFKAQVGHVCASERTTRQQVNAFCSIGTCWEKHLIWTLLMRDRCRDSLQSDAAGLTWCPCLCTCFSVSLPVSTLVVICNTTSLHETLNESFLCLPAAQTCVGLWLKRTSQ